MVNQHRIIIYLTEIYHSMEVHIFVSVYVCVVCYKNRMKLE